jgi:hypothetical protein
MPCLHTALDAAVRIQGESSVLVSVALEERNKKLIYKRAYQGIHPISKIRHAAEFTLITLSVSVLGSRSGSSD